LAVATGAAAKGGPPVERDASSFLRPEGAADSFEHVSRVVLDVVPIEELDVLLLKRSVSMVLLLPRQVGLDIINARLAHSECRVPLLPTELTDAE
jgi:hypothetical protein